MCGIIGTPNNTNFLPHTRYIRFYGVPLTLSDLSVSGGKITGSTLGTAKFLSGVNTSLGYADFANGVFNGYNTAPNIIATNVTTTNLYLRGGGLYVTYGGQDKHLVFKYVTIDGKSYGLLAES